MRRTLRDLADARKELFEIQQEFVRLQKRIEAVRDSVADSLVRLFGEERPAFAGLREEQLIKRIASSVVARLGNSPKPQAKGEQRYVREKEAGNLRDRWPTVAPPMRDSFGEVACLDSQPPRPPCDSALMRVAAYGFVFFIYENPFPGSRYMHFDPHNSI
jgi:hypothetical protein